MRSFWPWSRRREPRSGGIRLGGVDLGDRPWLVLGGGGLKGMAHLGAWRVLLEAGFRPAGIVGSSIGALVGACLAGGRPVDELEDEARKLDRDQVAPVSRRAIWVNGVRTPAVFRSEVFLATLERLLPHGSWDTYPIPIQMNAMEIGTGRVEWFGTGARTDVPPLRAVYASAALPVFYAPAVLPGGVYVDGGAWDALPMDRAMELGATGIVAIDVGSGGEVDGAAIVARGMLSIHQRVFSLMVARRRLENVAAWSGPPLLYLRPRLDGYGSFDFEHIPYFLEEGARAARELLATPAPLTPAP
jgi:NTE family protein